jgi:hypothetical protein
LFSSAIEVREENDKEKSFRRVRLSLSSKIDSMYIHRLKAARDVEDLKKNQIWRRWCLFLKLRHRDSIPKMHAL